ncbi:STAS domain-containing protein [Streptomyces sp. 5-6(2022)]|uniref:STAS domain-containing protein n=1 Tax=Streptomyces sp. 5-6(2022) TaxID=2936510 RepID=UPI0023B9DC87|nr:STAS domain-containing protein [Streptomyces sp. 5-6(2022)]
MTQQGAPRDAPVPLDRGARGAAGEPAGPGPVDRIRTSDGDPAATQDGVGGEVAAGGASAGDVGVGGATVRDAAAGDAIAGDAIAGDAAVGDTTVVDAAAPRVRTHRVGGYTVVELHGEIDIAGVGSVGPALDAATAGDGPAVIVDLRPTAFFDCSGLGLLCRAHRRVRERGGRMRLVCDDALILRTLRAGRMLDVLRPVATLDEALRAEED